MSQEAVPGAGSKVYASSISKSQTSGSRAKESPRVLVWCSARARGGIGAGFRKKGDKNSREGLRYALPRDG